jgi:hypothetical protein
MCVVCTTHALLGACTYKAGFRADFILPGKTVHVVVFPRLHAGEVNDAVATAGAPLSQAECCLLVRAKPVVLQVAKNALVAVVWVYFKIALHRHNEHRDVTAL